MMPGSIDDGLNRSMGKKIWHTNIPHSQATVREKKKERKQSHSDAV